MLLNKVPPRLDFFAHQRAEHEVGLARFVRLDLEHGALGGIESRLPQLVGVHFTEALEARDGQAFLADLANFPDQLAQVWKDAAAVSIVQEEPRRRLPASDAWRRNQVGGAEAEL